MLLRSNNGVVSCSSSLMICRLTADGAILICSAALRIERACTASRKYRRAIHWKCIGIGAVLSFERRRSNARASRGVTMDHEADGTGRDALFLRRCFEVARAAHAAGNHPFGAILVGPDGTVLMEQGNGFAAGRDMTAHAERVLMTRASQAHAPAVLASCTMYASAEPCAMCAGAAYWAGIGRVVYGLGEGDLKRLTGRKDDAAGQRRVEVVGPMLVEEAAALHEGAWDARADP